MTSSEGNHDRVLELAETVEEVSCKKVSVNDAWELMLMRRPTAILSVSFPEAWLQRGSGVLGFCSR